MQKQNAGLLGLLCVCLVFASSAQALKVGDLVTAPDGGFKPIKEVKLGDYSWVLRTLAKPPALKSANPRYTILVLGDGKKSAMTMVWDESGGTGTGYDTLYADKNFNGDLTEANEKIQWAAADRAKPAELGDLKEVGGEGVYSLSCWLGANAQGKKPEEFLPVCGAKVKTPQGSYEIAVVAHYTGGMHNGADLKSAPVYQLHGDLLPIITWNDPKTGKAETIMPGTHLGPFSVHDNFRLGFVTGIPGDNVFNRFDIFWAAFPASVKGTSGPIAFLRVQDKNGRLIEELPFCGGGS